MDMTEVRSAEQATEIAVSFLKRHRMLPLPISALRYLEDSWEVKLDVGAFVTRIATVHIHAKTGEITDYTVPVEEGKKSRR